MSRVAVLSSVVIQNGTNNVGPRSRSSLPLGVYTPVCLSPFRLHEVYVHTPLPSAKREGEKRSFVCVEILVGVCFAVEVLKSSSFILKVREETSQLLFSMGTHIYTHTHIHVYGHLYM